MEDLLFTILEIVGALFILLLLGLGAASIWLAQQQKQRGSSPSRDHNEKSS
jgi:type II secretory pathway pseudopilin PulG